MNDMLEDLFKKQRELDELIRETKKSQNLDYDYSTAEWIDKLSTAMIAEAVELKEETNWKWWKKPKEIDVKNIKEELVDILHFWISLCLKLGFNSKDIFQAYLEKNEKNKKRQKEGY